MVFSMQNRSFRFKKRKKASSSAFYDERELHILTHTYTMKNEHEGESSAGQKAICYVFLWMLWAYLHIIVYPLNWFELNKIESFRDLIGKGRCVSEKKKV